MVPLVHLPLTSNISLFPPEAEQIERIRTWWLNLKSEKCVIKSEWWLFLREKSLWLGKCLACSISWLGWWLHRFYSNILELSAFFSVSNRSPNKVWEKKKTNFKNLFIIRKKSYISEKLFFQSCLPQIISILRILAQSSK